MVSAHTNTHFKYFHSKGQAGISLSNTDPHKQVCLRCMSLRHFFNEGTQSSLKHRMAGLSGRCKTHLPRTTISEQTQALHYSRSNHNMCRSEQRSFLNGWLEQRGIAKTPSAHCGKQWYSGIDGTASRLGPSKKKKKEAVDIVWKPLTLHWSNEQLRATHERHLFRLWECIKVTCTFTYPPWCDQLVASSLATVGVKAPAF